MIIKSMSRKQASFAQLFDYIVRDYDNDTRYNFTHNCFGTHRESILNEFYTNSDNLKKRKGSNYLYHEILSITRSSQLTEDQQKDLLRDITQQYINARAKDCLVFAGLHDEKENQLHYHLIISANKVNEKKRYYHSKQSFDDIKVNLEKYVLERYPQLEQDQLISKGTTYKKSSQTHEGEYIRRTGKLSKKQQFAEQLKQIFADARDFQDYNQRLLEENIVSYVRGENMGFITNDRKHRASTLGIMEEFDDMLLRFQTQQATKRDDSMNDKYGSNSQDETTSVFEKTGDILKEWGAGDFSQRENKANEHSEYDTMVKKRMAQMQAKYEDKELSKKQALEEEQQNGKSRGGRS